MLNLNLSSNPLSPTTVFLAIVFHFGIPTFKILSPALCIDMYQQSIYSSQSIFDVFLRQGLNQTYHRSPRVQIIRAES